MVEHQKKHSVSTRNLRLAALHAFFRYIQLKLPEYMELCNSILAVRSKKVPASEINYLSIEAIKTLLSTPDTAGRSGRRDLAVLALMYDRQNVTAWAQTQQGHASAAKRS
jgi:site-specific recombinase XerD